MSFKVFLEIVEIRTKLASLFPFIIGVLFSVDYFNQIQVAYTFIFFLGMLSFDMATTAINNFMDFKKAKSQVYKYEENIIGQSGVSPIFVRNLIFIMIGFSALVGIYLSVKTGWLFLVFGGICCFIGVFYTFGPVPLSRMPLGELFSGVTMGLGIFMMTIYLNVLENRPIYLMIDWIKGYFSLMGNIWSILAIILASLPLVFTIANIMLANNLRDIDRDIENHRYTLVYYIGRKQGMLLFDLLMYASYVAILVGLLVGIFQWPILVIFGSLPIILNNLSLFKKEAPAPKSFSYSIKNLIVFNASYVLGLLVSLIL